MCNSLIESKIPSVAAPLFPPLLSSGGRCSAAAPTGASDWPISCPSNPKPPWHSPRFHSRPATLTWPRYRLPTHRFRAGKHDSRESLGCAFADLPAAAFLRRWDLPQPLIARKGGSPGMEGSSCRFGALTPLASERGRGCSLAADSWQSDTRFRNRIGRGGCHRAFHRCQRSWKC